MPRGQNFKGKKPENSGVKKGSKNAKTLAWEKLGDFITDEGAKKVSEILKTSDPADFFKYYCLLLEYFKPKLQRSEVSAKVESVTLTDIFNELK
jgi:hypothetical protein